MITATLRLIRLPNLLMIALTFFLVRFCLIIPAFQTEEHYTGTYPEHSSRIEFLFLAAATLCIAAAGYVINDVFDVITDSINKPGKNLFESTLKKSTGKTIFFSLSGIGAIIGTLLGLKTGKPAIAFIHLFAAFSLWMYASYYKRRLLSGNLLISLLSGLMVILPGLYEPSFYPNILYLLVYGGFAFLLTLAREIIKDIEDVDGDERMQCKTLPVRYGIKTSKLVALSVLLITAACIGSLLYFLFRESSVVSWWNLLLIFELPLAGLCYLLITASEKNDFHYASIFSKIYMLIGLVSMFPFWYYFLR